MKLPRISKPRNNSTAPRRAEGRPLRLLTAVPLCDGHDSAINTINLELIRHGVEVIYLGYHRSARDIARAAIQEDVRAVGLSSYNGGHVEFFSQVVRLLRQRGADDIAVFGGGGGTITPADARLMARRGVGRIFFAGTPLAEMVDFITTTFGSSRAGARRGNAADFDRHLAEMLTEATDSPLPPSPRQAGRAGGGDLAACGFANQVFGKTRSRRGNPPVCEAASGQITRSPTPVVPGRGGKQSRPRASIGSPRVVGITGPGGAGKTTLIDELALRFLRASPTGRLAILSHDPSLVGPGDTMGALLGDRAAMIHCQHDRVFMRSLATRGQAGGLSPATARCLHLLRESAAFDLILVETVGIGQEAMPFSRDLVDASVLVMSPDYGSRLQLQKIAMLDVADLVVVNKSDLAGAKTAALEVTQRLASAGRAGGVLTTTAKRHRDGGVDELFRRITAAALADSRLSSACPSVVVGRGNGC